MGIISKDIAKICGVSRGTVDRALNNKPRIKPETKERILKTAKELGYRPDLLARSLVKGKTMSLGVVVFDVRNRYFAQLLNSIEISNCAKYRLRTSKTTTPRLMVFPLTKLRASKSGL